jgi:aspartyl-tRNA(Asn)/glutamyl-tRNA(Gln) amidotransferase subunit A
LSRAIHPATLEAALAALQDGSWSSQGLCEWALERAQSITGLNAFVAVEGQSAEADAARSDRRRRTATAPDAPSRLALDGIPLAHKDLFYRPDRAPGCGSRAPAPSRPGQEAAVLTRLRSSGALDLGPLHLSEYAYGPTGHNAAIGHARNPWNVERVTGGSSSGSAVAVATAAVYGSLGSDSGGSIRTPASWCGVSGLKTTRGTIPLTGTMALAPTMDTIGIIARSAADLALILAAVAGPDGLDGASANVPGWSADAFELAQRKSVRLGIVDEWFHDGLSPAIATGLDRIRQQWGDALGARVVAADLPGLARIVANARTVLLHEAWRTHQPLLEQHDAQYSAGVRARLLAGSEIDVAEYREARTVLPTLLQGTLDTSFGDADVLLLPCNPGTAPRIDETDLGAMQDPGPAVLKQVDGITRCLRPFNYLGLPALVLPGGEDNDGMPFGFQLVGRPGAEAALLALGMRWQTHTDWHRRAPPGQSW